VRDKAGDEQGRRWCGRAVHIMQQRGGIVVKAGGMVETAGAKL
jgi:hypothetical protein